MTLICKLYLVEVAVTLVLALILSLLGEKVEI